jgi:uncharacterized protein with NAD-binding domain and iron-sulfur cluster
MAGLTGEGTGDRPQKVVILGAGIGALSTAFLLTDPSLHGRYEVTVHCMGWRLGGKGASGRNASMHQRVEEHGLHIWFGAYRNAIAMMKACYGELGRGAPRQPFATFADAFTSQNRLVLTELVGNEWRSWPIDFVELPPFPDVPTVYGIDPRSYRPKPNGRSRYQRVPAQDTESTRSRGSRGVVAAWPVRAFDEPYGFAWRRI